MTVLSVLGRFGKSAKEVAEDCCAIRRCIFWQAMSTIANVKRPCWTRPGARFEGVGECAVQGLLETNPAAALAGKSGRAYI
jgi:hypothetical protein